MKKLQQSVNEMNKKVDGKEAEISKSKIELDNKAQELERSSSKIEHQKTIMYWGLFTVLLISFSILIWVFEKLIDWQWLTSHKQVIALKLLTNICVVFALLNIPLPKHWIIWLGTVFTGVIALLGFAFN